MSDNPNAHPLTDGSKFVVVKALVGENVYLLQGDDAQITLSHAEAAQDGLVEALEDAIAFMAGDISGSAQRDGIIKQAQAALSAIKGDKS